MYADFIEPPEPILKNDSQRIVEFLRGIGIPVEFGSVDESSFLPGLTIRNGGLIVEQEKLLSPGDMLHEAGHLAMMTPQDRCNATAPIDANLGFEIGAIAWSWAASQHLGLAPECVFHPGGYRGASASFIENFSAGRYVGVPLLQWIGLTSEKSFPTMTRWLRDSMPFTSESPSSIQPASPA